MTVGKPYKRDLKGEMDRCWNEKEKRKYEGQQREKEKERGKVNLERVIRERMWSEETKEGKRAEESLNDCKKEEKRKRQKKNHRRGNRRGSTWKKRMS